MLIRVLFLLTVFLLTACVQKANIHEVLQKKTLTTKPILVENKNIDVALQKVALKNLENQIKNPPLDVKLKSKVLKRGVNILVARGSLEDINNYNIISERYGNADIIVVMEIKSTEYNERKYISNVEDEFSSKYFCVEREAKAVALFNVLNPKTREVFFAKTYRGLDYKRYCDEKSFKPEKLPKKELILLKAIERTIGAFIRDFYSIL